tara:strand:+ start:40717 stop:41319 length:603 start_codon:yes stop_codon:yes gene_type:complete
MCQNYFTHIKTIFLSKIIILLILSVLAGCQWLKAADTTFLSGTNIKIPEGTPTFKKGFRDGCETVLNSRGNSFYRTRYSQGFRYDPKLIEDSEYKFAVSRGYGFCFNYVIRFLNEAGSDSYIVSPSNFDWSLGSIDNMVTSSDENLGFGLDQSVADNNIFSDIFDFTRSSTASGGQGKGVMSSNVFYGTNYKYFGSFWHE